MDASKLCVFHTGCIDCERTYEDARTEPCLRGDEWYQPGHPKHRGGPDA